MLQERDVAPFFSLKTVTSFFLVVRLIATAEKGMTSSPCSSEHPATSGVLPSPEWDWDKQGPGCKGGSGGEEGCSSAQGAILAGYMFCLKPACGLYKTLFET